MNRVGRVGAAFGAAWRSFVRRRVAVFFTFLFPAILILIFGALVRTGSGGGLFARPTSYYVPGYLAVVVLQTPLSRVGSEVARHRAGNRFEKLATTPLTRAEWLLAQTLVNVVLVGLAAVLVVGLVLGLTGAGTAVLSGLLVVTVPAGTVLFCGLGAILGRLADSQDGAVTAANAVGLPLLFLSETFVPPSMLPGWFRPFLSLSPLTYFSRATRAATAGGGGPGLALWVLLALAAAFFAAGAVAIPTTE